MIVEPELLYIRIKMFHFIIYQVRFSQQVISPTVVQVSAVVVPFSAGSVTDCRCNKSSRSTWYGCLNMHFLGGGR